MSITEVFCSSKIKDSSHWKVLESSFLKNQLTISPDVNNLTICELEELDYFKEKYPERASIICIESDDSLFTPEIELGDDNQFIYVLKPSELTSFEELIQLNIYTQEQVSQISKRELVSISMETINGFEMIESELVNESLFHIKAYLSIYKSIELGMENFNYYLESIGKKYSFELVTPKNWSLMSFVIPLSEEFYIGIKNDVSDLEIEDKSIIMTSLTELQLFYEDCGIKNEKNIDTYWQSVFTTFPIPMAIITTNGELLYHNTLFSKLKILPKQCLDFENDQKVEMNNELFICHKEQVEFEDEQLLYFQFVGTQKADDEATGGQQGTFEDLGIISSSIAHELNNPLAGILSALEVLVLIGSESEDVRDMKKAASRCKDLVSVFLGFAKSRPSQNSETIFIESLFKNALSLLRFRMVEANILFEIKTENMNTQDDKFNSSILTMILYLILNDVMTEYQHRKLIADDERDYTVIKGLFSCTENSISIHFDDEFVSIEDIEFNKLIHNLLQLEDLQWEATKNSLRLSL